MGLFKINKRFTTGLEVLIILAIVITAGTGFYFFGPGITGQDSVELESLELDETTVNNNMSESELNIPTITPSIKANKKPLVRIAGYAWNGESGIILANGGPRTTKGSLMEQNGVNLEIIRQDWLSELRNMQMKFVEQYHEGQEYPKSNKSAFAIMIMGDGAPFYVSTFQDALNKKFGEGTYHVQVFGCVGGMSNGEDKLIGPQKWKDNPQTMIGSLISTVPGDGDWVTALNYCFANNLKVNPDFSTYDPNAVNFFPSAEDDYINSAKELIASQQAGFTVELNEIVDGKLTGNKINKAIDGCATWTPGDKMVFDALSGFTDVASTADFPNQMATTLIGIKEWADQHPDIVQNIFKSALTAANQMKQYDTWRKEAGNAVARTFKISGEASSGQYWYDMYQGQTATKAGVTYNMGGTRALNYMDVMQYYGEVDGINRYEAVYNQVSNYLVELNPFNFNTAVSRVVPYNEAVNLTFLKNIEGMVQSTQAETTDYSEDKTNTLAMGNWNINFTTGSAKILSSSYGDINTIYNLLVQAEQTKIVVKGYTDSQGNDEFNLTLSDQRAQAVVEHLMIKGLSIDRIQAVTGYGEADPVASNATSTGRAENRRVAIEFLQ